jgi:hypothetical protein
VDTILTKCHLAEERLHMHPGTFELIQRAYLWKSRDYPTCISVQQLYNTIRANSPDIHAAVAEVQRGTQRLLEAIRRYPDEAEHLSGRLFYVEEFFELVQETSAYLQNGEPAKRAALAYFEATMPEPEERA